MRTIVSLLSLWLGVAVPSSLAVEPARPALALERRTIEGTQIQGLQGIYEVWENRGARSGRKIGLRVVVMPATGKTKRPDPVFALAGGPGESALVYARILEHSFIRDQRDIVLVDQRGAGESNPLNIRLAGSEENLQGYLDPIFDDVARFESARDALSVRADLRYYTTPIAMDDLDDVRRALGYDNINLMGGSYGTRAALVYMRRHPDAVRTAILNGVAPPSFKNPLFHARGAQHALEGVFAACRDAPPCRKSFPDLQSEFAAVLERLTAKPAQVEIAGPDPQASITVTLTRDAFAEALRVMLYSPFTARRVPVEIHRAYTGDLGSFATLGVRNNRSLRDALAFGMLLSVTCPEDVARIRPDEIRRATQGTFLGEARVRSQMAVCEIWPTGELPEDYGEPITSTAPTLVLSGTLDPVTPPRFGEETVRHLSHGLHLVFPGAHGVGGKCIESIEEQFLATGSVDSLDTSCMASTRLREFELPSPDSKPT